MLTSLSALAQIGVNTTAPTATLDVNGTTRIRTTAVNVKLPAAKDSVLVVDNNGNVRRTTSKAVVTSHLKSFVKGGFSNTGNVTIPLASNVAPAPFGFEEFDENNEYNPTTFTFTATNAGVYSVSSQIKASAALSVTTNFGIAILKNGVVVARSGFANLSLLNIDVSPPIRSVDTLVKLVPTDTITFQIYGDLINAGITGARADSFFWIAQQQ